MSLEQISVSKNEISSDAEILTSELPNEVSEYTETKNDSMEILKPDITYIENTKVTTLFEQNRVLDIKSLANSETNNDANEEKRNGLTEEEKAKVKEETGWPDEIIDALGSMEEYEIYKKAGLQAIEVNGKWCLIRPDIDMNQKDTDGLTNRQRMERGLPPITKDGKTVELHHIGQKPDSPLAELTTEEHRGVGNDTILHDKAKESEIDRNEFAKERREHWKSRTIEI
jgi:hypothetical protein